MANNLKTRIHSDFSTGSGVWSDYRKEITGHWTKLKWRYSAPPTVTSTFNGLSNVSCSFVACLDAPI